MNHAWKATRHDFRLETNPRIYVAILIWLAVIYFGFESNPQTFEISRETQGTLRYISALIIIFPIWLCGRVVISAAVVHNELFLKLKEIEEKIHNKERMQKSLTLLSDIVISFSNMYHKNISTDEEFELIKQEFSNEMQNAYNIIIEDISHAAANKFAASPLIRAGLVSGSYNNEHNQFRLVVNKRTEQLSQIIDAYSLNV